MNAAAAGAGVRASVPVVVIGGGPTGITAATHFRETDVVGVSADADVSGVAMMFDRVIWNWSEFCCRTLAAW